MVEDIASASASDALRESPPRAIRVAMDRLVAPMISCRSDAERLQPLFYQLDGLLNQLPLLAEKSRRDDPAWITLVRGRRGVDNGVVGDLRNLPGVVEVIVFAEGEAAVQYHVLLGVQRIGID